MKNTQCRVVLEYLIANGSITSMEAFEKFGATRLSAIIHHYRKLGYNIVTESITGRNRYGQSVVYAKYHFVGYPEDKSDE